MPVKVKEIKDDVIIDIKVNKTFYLMSKSLSTWIALQLKIESPDDLKKIMQTDFDKLSDPEKAFYTTALLLAEIEYQANEQDKLEDKEILVPGDEGYEGPDPNAD